MPSILFFVLGAALIVAGAAWFSTGAALIAAGVLSLGVAWDLNR